jgi:hypothetical protein
VNTSSCSKSGVEQFANQKAQPASGVEMVHVGVTIRVDLGQQRHHARQRIKIAAS